MTFTDTIKKLIGSEEDVYEENYTQEEIEEAKANIAAEEFHSTAEKPSSFRETMVSSRGGQSVTKPSSAARFSIAGTSALKLVVIEPKGFNECEKLVESLKNRRPIIINLDKLDTETAKKIFDFLSGATFAINGNVQKIANNIFVFAPENIDIDSDDTQESGGFQFQIEDGDSNPWISR